MTTIHFSRVSGNLKTGPIPVSSTSADSCPTTCALYKKGCYGKTGPLSWHWKKVTSGERGESVSAFLANIKALPNGQLWRHNQVGDLLHNDGEIDINFLTSLVIANKRKKGFTYTHHLLTEHNISALKMANLKGFTVNVSTDTAHQAVNTVKAGYGLPVVTVLPLGASKVQTIDGVKIVKCPAQNTDKVTCSNCGLCADSQRDYVIGFEAHGTAKKTVNLIASA